MNETKLPLLSATKSLKLPQGLNGQNLKLPYPAQNAGKTILQLLTSIM
jgi:hypothetical protein